MILRRLSTALRKQDWLSVLIETSMVVFGVFMGLQVNNWNEARSVKHAEAELIDSLAREFAELKTSISNRMEEIGTLEKNVSELLDMVRNDVAPTDSAAVIALLNATWTSPRLPSPPASYAEAISAGRLSTLSDPELRRSLSRYGQLVELYQLALPSFSEPLVGRDSLFVRALRISSDLEVVSDPDGGIEGYDWEILKTADHDVQMALVWAVAGKQLAQTQLHELETMLKLLASEPAP